jgi:hypothetical protein
MKRLIAPFCLIAALAASPAQAAVLLDNTSLPISSSVLAGIPQGSYYRSINFSVGSTAYTLGELRVLLTAIGGPITADLTVELFAYSGTPGSGSIPGTPFTGSALASKTLTNLSVPGNSGLAAADVRTIDLTSGSTGSWLVLANQSYGLVFSTPTANLNLATTTSGVPTGSAGLTVLGRTVNNVHGTFDLDATNMEPVWLQLSDSSSPSAGGSSSVPDAGPGPALALLLGGFGLRQWRRNRRTGAAA